MVEYMKIRNERIKAETELFKLMVAELKAIRMELEKR